MSVGENLAAVQQRIAAACGRAGRDPAAVRIIAVSKTQPADAVVEAIAAGVDAIGENRVQEAAAKRPQVAGDTPWHLIGPLQRNKAKAALELFDVVETVDRPEIADRLEALLAPSGRVLPVLIEVNVGGEAQKSGVAANLAPALAARLLESCPHLALRGLMTVLNRLADELARRLRVPGLDLSMGMSEDFEVAVEEGATLVRLGRVLFGERRPWP